ncbi:hypothetical protein K7X08_010271 [Anisodus acutangulus]|uniref:Dienelactone hydrolase domain-containing protein n=1 Tax=Anisodus acutangulus TaxID=402998 RepID=A0A9Q1N4V9_9SOLA|nr:hypothetical protein K7X08_010271 [Anisodus acutangulus]
MAVASSISGALNIRKLADKVAAAGYLVMVPDFFYGEPLDREKHDIQTWLKDHGTDKGCEDAKAVVESMKSKGVSAIGAAGFCWGGMTVSKLAKYESTIGAAVILHPGPITVDEINGVEHRWTVRYNVEDESATKVAEEAHSDMLNWFTKFIK